MGRWMSGWLTDSFGWVDGWMNGQVCKLWMYNGDGWVVNGWMGNGSIVNGWMEGLVGRWKDRW